MSRELLTRDEWLYGICLAVAKGSKCLSRQIGAVLVRDNSIISTGYNGPPRGTPHCWDRYKLDPILRQMMFDKGLSPDDPKHYDTCPRYTLGFKSGEGLDLCVAGHAERNALINAARHGIDTKGAKLYMDCGVPCTPCLVEIINSGIEEIIVSKMVFYDISAQYLLHRNDTLECRVYDHLE